MSSQVCTARGGRGCPCAFHARRRIYSRTYAARQRRRVIDAKRMSAQTCPRGFGRYGRCGAVLHADVVGGLLVVTCPACERMTRGLCRDCNAPVDGPVGRARRCAVHRAKANRASVKRYAERSRDDVNARARASYQDEAVRRHRNEYKRAWRKRNRDKVKEQKRRHALRQPEKVAEYQRAYRAAHRRKNNARQLARYYGTASLRTCITPRCSTVLTGRKKKCRRCKEREAQQAAVMLAGVAA